MISEKRCTACGEKKALAEFYPGDGAGGTRQPCRLCTVDRQREKDRARAAAKRGAVDVQPARSPVSTRTNGEPPRVMDDDKTPTTPTLFGGTADECILVFNDSHFPFNDPYWWALVLETARILKPTRVVLNGDIHDCRAVSQHERMTEHDSVSYEDERNESNKRLDEIDQARGNAKVHVIGGNHEFRLTRYLLNLAPAISKLEELKIENLYGYTRRGWHYTPYRSEGESDGCLDIGPVTFTHDLERAGANGVRSSVTDLRQNVVIGHLHRMSLWYEGDARGRALFGACFGWGGDFKKLSWRHRRRALREWRHGFGIVWIKDDLAFPQPVAVVNKTAIFGTRIMRAL